MNWAGINEEYLNEYGKLETEELRRERRGYVDTLAFWQAQRNEDFLEGWVHWFLSKWISDTIWMNTNKINPKRDLRSIKVPQDF